MRSAPRFWSVERLPLADSVDRITTYFVPVCVCVHASNIDIFGGQHFIRRSRDHRGSMKIVRLLGNRAVRHLGAGSVLHF